MQSKETKGIEVIFVDFFDTLVFRRVTPREVIERWSRCIGRKYPSINKGTIRRLPTIRLNTFSDMRNAIKNKDVSEVTYEQALGRVFDNISGELGGTPKEDFIRISKEIDLAIEYGCEYKNEKLVNELERRKKQGEKIYILSDYYLNANDLRSLLYSNGIDENLFDDIFVSCDIGKRKANGDLFKYVLDKLNVSPDKTLMIGDNKKSDCEIPESFGMNVDFRPNLAYKSENHLSAKLGKDFANKQYRVSSNEMYKKGQCYSEYIDIFYVFTKRLFFELKKDDVNDIAFMAREGFYLRDLFNIYQSLSVPDDKRIKTSYFWCSRRSVMSGIKSAQLPESMDGEISLANWLKSLDISLDTAKEYIYFTDEEAEKPEKLEESKLYQKLMNNPDFVKLFNSTINENNKAFLKYTKPFVDNGTFRFVDSGWKCTTQNAIQKYYGIDTEAYYIGVQKADKPILDLKRKGLIFSEEKPRSRYYEYLGTNIPFYQQLLAAPHGTAIKYIDRNGKIEIKSEWDPMEEKLFHEKMENLQKYMKMKFMGLCAWDDKKAFDSSEDWYIARLSMRSSLFAKGERLKFIRECTDNYVQNFRQENRGKVRYDASKVKIGPDVIWKPDKLIRYFGKVQRTDLYDKKSVRMIYPAASHILYGYILLIQSFKNIGRKGYELNGK